MQEEKVMTDIQLIIGVDGGGSKSAAAAAAPDGRVLAFFRGEGINYNIIGMDAARHRLKRIVDALLERCGAENAAVSVGMPALDTTADAETVRRFAGDAFAPETLLMESDAYMALLGLTLGESGMMVICGTGSMALLDAGDGEQRISGGWGYLLGDPGSGCAIAMDALRAAIGHWEKTGPETVLAEKARKFFGLDTPRRLIDRVYAPEMGIDGIARFAPEVFSAAREDAVARIVIEKNMDALASQAAALLRTAPGVNTVGLYGGIFQHREEARRLFARFLREKTGWDGLTVALPRERPELGALIHYFKKQGRLNESTLQTLLDSFHSIAGQETEE